MCRFNVRVCIRTDNMEYKECNSRSPPKFCKEYFEFYFLNAPFFVRTNCRKTNRNKITRIQLFKLISCLQHPNCSFQQQFHVQNDVISKRPPQLTLDKFCLSNSVKGKKLKKIYQVAYHVNRFCENMSSKPNPSFRKKTKFGNALKTY